LRALRLLVASSCVALACTRSPPRLADVEEGPPRPLAASSSRPAASPDVPAALPEVPSSPVAAAVPLPPSRPEARQTLVAEGGHVVEVYPPLDAVPAATPLVVFLHATCMQPVDICDFWSNGGRAGSWLVCPAGPSTCFGAPDWSGTPKVKAAALGHALAAVDTAYAPWVDHERGDVLIGYSRGAYAARDILYEGPGRFRGLILLSAYVKPDPARLKTAGIRRALLATGDLDESGPTMRRAAKTLDAAGIPAKFVSLGKIGHWLPDDVEVILRDAIAWVEGPAS
jgi:predicted esterase